MQKSSGGRKYVDGELLLEKLTWTCGSRPDMRNMVAQIRSSTSTLSGSSTLTMNGLDRKSRDNNRKIEYGRRAMSLWLWTVPCIAIRLAFCLGINMLG